MDLDFTPKLTKWDNVRWTSCGRTGYSVVGEGTTSRVLVDSKNLVRVERPGDRSDGQGWDVVVLGEVVEHHRLKVDAQLNALTYLV